SLSKKAQKKARKAAYIQEKKLERRMKEKEARKEKKRKRAERIELGEEVSEDERAHKRVKGAGGPRMPFNARVVVDLGFDDKMTEKEISSLVSQLAYTYSANRRSSAPFTQLLFTSLNGRTFERLEKMNDAGYKRWGSTEWWHEEYDRLWLDEAVTAAGPEESEEARSAKADTSRARAPQSTVVYLTADSADVLEELKDGETYIIGGICDHNRYKNLCLNKATASGIRAVQLPIGRYMSNLPTRKVLTVNQVFEILVRWTETRDWGVAFYSVIPKRKFQGGEKQRIEGGE
ncbi:guanine-1-methyltransferase-domain-containing protein, partial [Vararia minispora EC-137]